MGFNSASKGGPKNMVGQTFAWLITIYYTISRPCFSELQVPNNSLLYSNKCKASKKKKLLCFHESVLETLPYCSISNIRYRILQAVSQG